jgi:hypothetical protein
MLNLYDTKVGSKFVPSVISIKVDSDIFISAADPRCHLVLFTQNTQTKYVDETSVVDPNSFFSNSESDQLIICFGFGIRIFILPVIF